MNDEDTLLTGARLILKCTNYETNADHLDINHYVIPQNMLCNKYFEFIEIVRYANIKYASKY